MTIFLPVIYKIIDKKLMILTPCCLKSLFEE